MVILSFSPQSIVFLPHLCHKVKPILFLFVLTLPPGERHLIIIAKIGRVVVGQVSLPDEQD